MKRLFALCVAAFIAAPALGQDFPKPGPEIEMLKKLVGNWDATMKVGGMESKCTCTYSMSLGGLWLSSKFEGDMGGGMKFEGHGMDSYDAKKKKFIGVWFDSMSTLPMVMEGDYNAAAKTMTMVGEARDMEGKMAKHKIVTTMKDENTFDFAMYVGDAKDPMFTIVYKRKK